MRTRHDAHNPARDALLRALAHPSIADASIDADRALAALTALAYPPPPDAAQPYARRAAPIGSSAELLLVTWRPGAWSWPHDHGESRGVGVALDGSLVERRFALDAGGARQIEERAWSEGTTVMFGAGAFHAVSAPRGARTLHVYAPAPTWMRLLDLRGRRTVRVGAGCGAWEPEPSAIETTEPWAER